MSPEKYRHIKYVLCFLTNKDESWGARTNIAPSDSKQEYLYQNERNPSVVVF